MGKGSANLYEILRQATNGPGDAARAHPVVPAVDDPPRKAATATVTPPPLPSPPNVEHVVRMPETVHEPLSALLPMPAPRLRVEAPPPRPTTPLSAGPVSSRSSEPEPEPESEATSRTRQDGNVGDRSIRLTYNVAAFGALVALGVLFLAYSVGVRVGRSSAAPVQEAPRPTPSPESPRGPAPVIEPTLFAVQLMEWSTRTQEEKTKALAAAGELKRLLDQKNLKEGRIVTVDQRLILLYGTYENRTGDAARAALASLKALKLRKGEAQPTFAKAGFVEVRR